MQRLLGAYLLYLNAAFGQVSFPHSAPLAEVRDPATLDQRNGASSLNATLQLLKQEIPLADVQYVRFYVQDGWIETNTISLKANVTNFDSCTVGFGSTELSTAHEHPDWGSSAMSEQYRVPLGELTDWTVARKENQANPKFGFFTGQRWGYRLVLKSNGRKIKRLALFSAPASPRISGTTSELSIVFSDESLALEVATAFHHASDLCRSQGSGRRRAEPQRPVVNRSPDTKVMASR